MRLRLEPRARPSRWIFLGAPLLAAALTVLTGAALFSALGADPLQTLDAFFLAPLRDRNGIAEWLLKASPLALIACGLAIGFRANVWNIGAEGQLVLGAIGASALAIRFDGTDSFWLLPAMIGAGALAGMAWAGIAAWLKVRFHANEILVTLMLAYIATLLLSWLVHGPMRDPDGQNFPQSILFGDSALFPILWPDTRLNSAVFLSVSAALAAWLLMRHSFAGFRFQVGGLAPRAARYAGFSESRAIWVSLLIGGAAAGIAGVGEVAGPLGQLQPAVSPGYGYGAIIVAFLGRLHPAGIVLAALLMSLLYIGGESAQVTLQLPSAVAGLFQGLLLFFLLGCDVLTRYRVHMMAR